MGMDGSVGAGLKPPGRALSPPVARMPAALAQPLPAHMPAASSQREDETVLALRFIAQAGENNSDRKFRSSLHIRMA